MLQQHRFAFSVTLDKFRDIQLMYPSFLTLRVPFLTLKDRWSWMDSWPWFKDQIITVPKR